MIKKKTRTVGQATKKSVGKKRSKKKIDPTKVREALAGMVKSEAKSITEAVIDQAMQGELAPAKYLLELAGVFPPANDGEQATEEEDCLAKTLLDRLNISRKPVKNENDDEDANDNKVKNSGDASDEGKDSSASG